MPHIQVLDKQVSELIAAGEVIERPASIVKELLENAVDAGATAVTVEIKNGGVRYIRVTDNGCGIAREDASVAFLRHATSKVRTEEDLSQIGTLGFRGEALASICAVARVELLTKRPEDDFGTRVTVEGGEITGCEEAGCPDGTTVMVRDLFYNVPARLKFMKKDVSEANAIASIVDKVALSRPDVSFKMIREGKQEMHSPGDGDLLNAIYAVLGREFAAGMMPVDYELNGVKVKGYASIPMKSRANRSMQHFFINGRYVKTRTAGIAMEEAYKNSIMVGKFPACVLNLTLPLSQVDVNVHPAKIEVRFVNEKMVFDGVYFAIKSALSRYDSFGEKKEESSASSTVSKPAAFTPAKGEQLPLEQKAPPAAPFGFSIRHGAAETKAAPAGGMISQSKAASSGGAVPSGGAVSDKSIPAGRIADGGKALYSPVTELEKEEPEFRYIRPQVPAKAAPSPEMPEEEPQPADMPAAPIITGEPEIQPETGTGPALRMIGELFGTYILLEADGEFAMIDKHAAHERIIFEQLKSGAADLDRQVLLSPSVVTLSKEEHAALLDNKEITEKLGFSIEDFGNTAVLVREVPVILDQADIPQLVGEIAGNIRSMKKEAGPQVLEDLYHSVACKAAIKAHDDNDPAELERLAREVYVNHDIRYCPHGRPVVISMSRREIEKKFGRQQ